MNVQSPDGAAHRRELLIGLGCALLVLVVWTSFHISARLGVRSNFPPEDMLAIRMVTAGAIMLPWFLRSGFGGLTLTQSLVLMLAGGFGFSVFAYWAYTLAPISHAVSLMTGTVPLQTAILSMIVLHERFSNMKLVGLALTVGGVFLVGLEGLMVEAPGQWRGDVMFFLASTGWAIYTILAQRWRVKPVQAATVVYVPAMIIYLPIYLLAFESKLAEAPLGELAVQIVIQGVFSTILTMMAFTRMIYALGATVGAMLIAAVPALTTLLAIPLVGEQPDLLAVAGIACVTAGIVATLFTLRRPQPIPKT